MRPLLLGPNRPRRFYRGGARIAELRGMQHDDEWAPEDWVGSVTTAFGTESDGLSRLEGGGTLAAAMAAEPDAFLGPEHVARHGGDPRLLVKLLDAGERLPVHLHPDRAFARRHLGVAYGKSEAWVVLAAEGKHTAVHVGLRDHVDARTLADWVERQDTEAMTAALNRLPVSSGDAIFVPAGLPHAIDEGVFLLELQEPSDLSVLLEWKGFQIDGRSDGHLGLGFETALQAVDRSPPGADGLRRLVAHRGHGGRPGVERLLPPEADAFFRAERIRPRPSSPLAQEYSILVVLDGDGRLHTAEGELELRRGTTVLVPYAAGEGELRGDVDVLRCLPPEVDA